MKILCFSLSSAWLHLQLCQVRSTSARLKRIESGLILRWIWRIWSCIFLSEFRDWTWFWNCHSFWRFQSLPRGPSRWRKIACLMRYQWNSQVQNCQNVSWFWVWWLIFQFFQIFQTILLEIRWVLFSLGCHRCWNEFLFSFWVWLLPYLFICQCRQFLPEWLWICFFRDGSRIFWIVRFWHFPSPSW